MSPPSARRNRRVGPAVLPLGVEEFKRRGCVGPRYRGPCPQCGTWRAVLHRDHIIPLWRGGEDTPQNIQLLCANCHEDKTHKDYKGFKHTDATKRLISEVKKGTKLSAEHRSQISTRMKGRVKSEAHLAKLRKPRSAQGRKNIKEGHARYWSSLTPSQRKKTIERRWATRRAKEALRP